MTTESANSTHAPVAATVPWSLGDGARGIGLVAAWTVLLVFLVGPVSGLFDGSRAVVGLLLSAFLEVLLLLAVWRFGPWRYGQSWRALGLAPTFNRGVPLALVAFVASIGFVALYAGAMIVLGLKQLAPPPLPSELLETYTRRIAAFLLIVLLAPVAEEIFFRGFLLPAFARRWGFAKGATFTSLLFSVSHVAAGLLIPAFVSGLLLAWLYRRTGSLWNCTLAHGAQNALAFAVAISL